MALSLAIIWLTISANRSLNQASSKQFVMSTQACAFFEQMSASAGCGHGALRFASAIPLRQTSSSRDA
jgi:hypothetical protein